MFSCRWWWSMVITPCRHTDYTLCCRTRTWKCTEYQQDIIEVINFLVIMAGVCPSPLPFYEVVSTRIQINILFLIKCSQWIRSASAKLLRHVFDGIWISEFSRLARFKRLATVIPNPSACLTFNGVQRHGTLSHCTRRFLEAKSHFPYLCIRLSWDGGDGENWITCAYP